MPAHDPGDRSALASAAAHHKAAFAPNRSALTADARKAFEKKFVDEVDPTGVMPVEERTKRAANAKAAYFKRLALKSVQARRAKAAQ
jgi:hypothetical protein